ncbi:IRK-interacting protein isoform X1 [Iris pallida]|uniref:IRK-interacting protein isoform X1 n=1 Tax=Iris pallida TaxID=29817 RepID=A0AAX6HIV5_IRIPA|nr:IRK-interacting protein isoform X1 [Iris pallida]
MNISSSHAMVSSDALQVGHGVVQRQDIRAAMAKAVELRALHAALLQGSSSCSPLCRPPSQASSQDYPVFAPTYEEQQLQLPGYHYDDNVPEDHSVPGNWSKRLERVTKADEIYVPDTESSDIFLTGRASHRRSCTSHPGANIVRTISSTQTSSACTPATTTREVVDRKKAKEDKGAKFSWLFRKKKPKPAATSLAITTLGSEDVSRVLKDWGALSTETLKKELLEANESRDAAVSEVAEVKSSLGELREKLGSLESHCETLKKALKQAQGRETSKRSTMDCSVSMPVSQEVMVGGFLQIVSEARLSVKKFCKTLIDRSGDADSNLTEKLDKLLQPHQLSLGNQHPKGALYHLEALINQSFYQDFENCVFRRGGCPKVLDPQQDRLENFASFVALRRLSWNEVLRKGTRSYSDDFSRFCDRKMGGIVSALNWLRPWPEELLQSFFVAAKCMWLLHLLAFSFSPHLAILRVEEDRSFDPVYMEEIPLDRKKARAPEQKVKIMVMPGFYVQDRVLRCRVLCRCRAS